MKKQPVSKWEKRIARKQAKRARKYKRKQKLANKHHNMPRFQGRNYHHLKPRSLGGSNHVSNLLLIDIERHQYWHKLFGLKTLPEVINLLIRLERMKGAQR